MATIWCTVGVCYFHSRFKTEQSQTNNGSPYVGMGTLTYVYNIPCSIRKPSTLWIERLWETLTPNR